MVNYFCWTQVQKLFSSFVAAVVVVVVYTTRCMYTYTQCLAQYVKLAQKFINIRHKNYFRVCVHVCV